MIDAGVLVVGAGAIGGVTAAKMKGGVRRVSVLDADKEHVERMRDPGLLLDELGEERHVRLDAHADLLDLEGPFDFALVTLKAPHLEAALGPLVERGLAATFVSLGNGLVQDRIAGIVGGENLVVGTVEWGATNLGAGHLAQTTQGLFVIGEPEGETKDRTRLLAEALGMVAGVRITENISGQVWSKLLVNSAFSGLGAVSGLLYSEVVADPSDLEGPFDFALVTLKAPHLEAALTPLVERSLARTFVSLGNGLVQDRIAAIVGGENLIVGTVEWGATNLGAGRLARTTRAPFVIGEPDGEAKDRTRLLADALGTVADVRITENIGGQVWSKLLVNSAFSGLGAVSGLLYREVVADPAGKEAALAVWREGYDVGMAQGITLDKVLGVPAESLVVRGPDDQRKADEALRVAMGYAGATKASMLQDLERGAKTEVDVINGGVVGRGREYGVETPFNERVVELMHAMERGERRPGRDAFEELRTLAG